MTYFKTEFGYSCDHVDYRRYLCFEHTTYLFEFSKRFGPTWFTVPGDIEIFPEVNGTMSFLWDFLINL